MNESSRDMIALLGNLGVSVAGAAAAAYALFRFLGDKWLTEKFSERLESYKHAQQQELERLKLKINTLLDRATKLNNQEFEVLPEIWSRLNDAFYAVLTFVSPLKAYPDLDRMGSGELEDYLQNSHMPDWEKQEVRTSAKKSERYRQYRFWYDLNRTQAAYTEFRNYYVKKGIFLQPELKQRIDALSRLMDDALVEQEIEAKHPQPGPDRFQSSGRFRDEGKALLDEIGNEVQQRLLGRALRRMRRAG